MSKEIKTFLDYLTSQTGLSAESMANEIAMALEQVVMKSRKYPEDAEIKVHIDPNNGDMEIFRVFHVVNNDKDDINSENEITTKEAEKIQIEAGMNADAKEGQSIYQALDIDLGRIAATQAKHLFKKIIQDGKSKNKKTYTKKKLAIL